MLAGCGWDAPPVAWESPTPLLTRSDSATRYSAHWTPGAPTAEVVVRGPEATPAVAGGPECPGSRAVAARVAGREWSVWWQARPDSSATLIAARRDSLGAVQLQVVVDSVDRALLGCARPAPVIAVDSVNGYVHVAYFMVAPEGPGVFYAHLMPPQTRFELPMAMVYGEKPADVAIASRGDTVVVAYEDPNSEHGRIALSLSLTAGHLFEQTARLVPVSTSSRQAFAPEVVRLSGGELWVGWTEESQAGSAYLLRRARIVSR